MTVFLQRGASINRKRTIDVPPSQDYSSAIPLEWHDIMGPETRFWGVGRNHSKPQAGDPAIFMETQKGGLRVLDVLEVLTAPVESPALAAALGWDRAEDFAYVFPLRLLWAGEELITDPAERSALTFPSTVFRSWIPAPEAAQPTTARFIARVTGLPPPPPPRPTVTLDRKLVKAHILAGKNVILYGPPGSGKTRASIQICESDFGVEYDLETGSPEWTPYDVVGGLDLAGRYRKGFLVRTLVKCALSLKARGVPRWLVLDEINRANMDLAFADAFTLLDIAHRSKTALLDSEEVALLSEEDRQSLESVFGERRLSVPLSFRIIGTMNSYDRALLFRLGYALARRFALIPWSSVSLGATSGDFEFKDVRKYVPEVADDLLRQAESELKLAFPQYDDYAVIRPEMANQLDAAAHWLSAPNPQLANLPPLDVAGGFLGYLNDRLAAFEGELIRVENATFVDVFRFLVGSKLANVEDPVRILDEAMSAYVIPQIDVLGRYVRSEKLGLGASQGSIVSDIVAECIDAAKAAGFTARTLPLLQRITSGQSAI